MKYRLETMMKIHTTQNLNSFRTNQPTSVSLEKNDRLKRAENYYLQSRNINTIAEDSVSFKGKGEAADKLADALRKANIVKKIEKLRAANDKSIMDKILTSGFFDGTLDLMTHETFIQAAISFLICVFLRPLTIMSIPTKKSKEDNKYASAHSMSSGFVGLASSVLIAIPFSKGLKYAQEHYIETLKPETLKKMFPHLNIESITDATGKRLPMGKWLDKFGNKFSKDMKNAMLMARPIHATEISEKTYEKFGIKLNKAANEGKPFAEWVDMDGKRVVEKLNTRDFCVAIEESGMGSTVGDKYKDVNFFSLEYIGDDLLEAACKDLDMASTKGVDGKRLHPIHWKKTNGEAYTEIFEATHLSSYTETADAVPLLLSDVRLDTRSKKNKYTAIQSNVEYETNVGVPERIGSPIKQESLDADLTNDYQNKWIIWLPDILSRPLVATATIALLPKILKNVFHLEKPKKQPEQEVVKPQLEGENAKLALASGKEVA